MFLYNQKGLSGDSPLLHYHSTKVYSHLYLHPIHRVFKPYTRCISIKYTVYIR